ncbi:MAG: ABC transporter substrate-binding protein [Burkholderiales bacterium]|nr:ABC transporter substrate-binding protein [Burkholderiales bacterium]
MIQLSAIFMLALAVLAAPFAAEAQQKGKVYRVGTLFPPLIHQSFRIEEFRQALRDHGYVEGQNFVLESRLIDPENFYRPDLAKELVSAGVDVIVTMEIAGGQAARQATETTPIVVVNCDPFRLLVASLARPGGNVTGQSCMSSELTPKRLELFKMAVPHLSRVAFLYNPKQTGPVLSLQFAQEAARSLGITVHPVEVRNVADFDQAFTKIAREHFDGLVVYQDFLTASQRPQIIDFAARTKLPAVYQFREWVDAGGFVSYGTNLRGMYRRAGVQVAKILSGVKPADLPIEQPVTFELIVNMKTARALGLTIPQSVLLRADEVIQ